MFNEVHELYWNISDGLPGFPRAPAGNGRGDPCTYSIPRLIRALIQPVKTHSLPQVMCSTNTYELFVPMNFELLVALLNTA